ncbi:MAG: DUF5706 domain-containing protein, partial [Candidatus Helarchaeota archaeon]|nr:DUF5706 domain-containing protein [Candidatus Helarchaeota archaeon]
FNFSLTKISDSKASTLVMISGQSILITAFLLANVIAIENAMPIALGFSISVIFNVIAIYFAISALWPRTFRQSIFYTKIATQTREEFINEFRNLQNLSKEENDRHYADLIYHISKILSIKMKYVQISSIIFFIGVGVLAISIFVLVFEVFF